MRKISLILLVILSALNLRGSSSIYIEKSGKGSPVIIIAGLGGNEVWLKTIEKLSVQNSCYLISIKGLSGDKSTSQINFKEIEKEILNFITEEKLNKPALMGHSFGGFIAMELTASNPEVFSRLIIVDAYPFGLALYNPAFTGDFGRQQSKSLQNQLTNLPESAYKSFWAQNVEQFTNDTTAQKNILEKILNSERKNVIDAQVYALSTDLRPVLASINCPVSAVCSSYLFRKAGLTDDQINERINQQFSSTKHCNIFITNEAKHFIMIDSPDWFLDKILDKSTL